MNIEQIKQKIDEAQNLLDEAVECLSEMMDRESDPVTIGDLKSAISYLRDGVTETIDECFYYLEKIEKKPYKYAVYEMSDLKADSQAELIEICDTFEHAVNLGNIMENMHESVQGYFTYIRKVLVDENNEIIAKGE